MHKRILIPLVVILLTSTACIGTLPGFLVNVVTIANTSSNMESTEVMPPEVAIAVTPGNARYASMPYFQREDGAWVLGLPDAPITIVEFADFRCPHCQNYKSTIDQLIDEYVVTGKANFEFRVYPILGDDSVAYAEIALCAGDLAGGGLWAASDILYESAINGASPLRAREDVLSALPIDSAALVDCMTDVPLIERNLQLGSEYGVTGTPSIRVRYDGGSMETIPGHERGGGVPLEVLVELIAEANQ